MARILRGDVVWADLEPARGREQAGRRPVLVISREIFNSNSGTVIAMAVTRREPRAGFPLMYPVPPGMLPKRSWIKISQLRTLSTERLGRRLARLPEADLVRIIEGLLDIVGA